MSWLRRAIRAVREGLDELKDQPSTFVGLCVLAGILLFTYGLVRPPTRSLFTEIYGAANLPWVMLAVAGVAVLAAGIYGRFAARVQAARLFFAAACVMALLFTALLIWGPGKDRPHVVFLLYVLMEVYIVVLVESFWTLANVTYGLKSARVAYGLFCASGSIGAGTAEFFQGDLATTIGTVNTIWLVVPVLVLTGWLCTVVTRGETSVIPAARKSISYREGWRVVLESRYLLLLLVIVASSQIVINIVDYHLTDTLDVLYPGEESRAERTAAFGQVYFWINVIALNLQILTAPILGLLGIAGVLTLIPGLITSSVAAALVLPRFATAAAAMVTAKATDYSLFRAAKEMLYLPLPYTEKTVGKAFVDMNTYRAAKAGASVLLLLLIPLGRAALLGVAAAMAALWLLTTLVLLPRYRAQRQDAAAGIE